MAEVVRPDLEALSTRLAEVEGYLHIDERRGQVAELEAKSAEPGFWDDADLRARAHGAPRRRA